jgi:DNA polymerase-3 subunit gamma/tau
MIARAAEGGARRPVDPRPGDRPWRGQVTAEQVRDMLGLADRGRIRRLLDTVLTGDAAATLAELDEAHALGIDPARCCAG